MESSSLCRSQSMNAGGLGRGIRVAQAVDRVETTRHRRFHAVRVQHLAPQPLQPTAVDRPRAAGTVGARGVGRVVRGRMPSVVRQLGGAGRRRRGRARTPVERLREVLDPVVGQVRMERLQVRGVDVHIRVDEGWTVHVWPAATRIKSWWGGLDLAPADPECGGPGQ